MSFTLYSAANLKVLTVCLFVMIGKVRMKQRFKELHVKCTNESQLMQVSGYTQKYFNTDNYRALREDLRNSPIHCMWEKSCIIKTRKGRKRKEKWFEKNMRCLKKETKIYDLISNETLERSPSDVMIRELGDQTIIVRSHQNFPWNYKYCYTNSIHSLNFKTERKHLEMKVALRVLWSEINEKHDELFLQHGNVLKQISRGSGYLEINITELKDVKLKFKTDYMPLKTCETSVEKGFLICMKFLSRDQQRYPICDEVVDDVTLNSEKKG
ncbi:uncharacterized protein LOC133192974 [Saccostrea echinata]|uniref:uncharacterized protein LOC133192974 n=1 Tax=Saccostrea echinata TaxID=191078 RepID=UPI002A7EB112|nr:uncharacterized protein LOC133192974 [Saccostrea echinata]